MRVEIEFDLFGRFAECVVAAPQIVRVESPGVPSDDLGHSLVLIQQQRFNILNFRVVLVQREYLLVDVVDLCGESHALVASASGEGGEQEFAILVVGMEEVVGLDDGSFEAFDDELLDVVVKNGTLGV